MKNDSRARDIERLKRQIARIQSDMEAMHGRLQAEVSAIDEQIDVMLSAAGILEGIKALEGRRAGAMHTFKEESIDLQRKQEDTMTAIRVLTETDSARSVAQGAVSLG